MEDKPRGEPRKHRTKPGARAPSAEKPSGEPVLSRDRIVAAAVDLLDHKGIEGLTMRGLADGLGSGVMSLYWHVESKEGVFDLALDAVLEYRRSPGQAETEDWREAIMHVLEDWRACMLRHPWSASLLPRRALGPNILHRLELLGKALRNGGVADDDLNVAIWTLWNHVMGATITRASFDHSDVDSNAVPNSVAARVDLYPTIGGSGLLLDGDWEGAFSKGLDILLDGLSRQSLRPEGTPNS